MGQPKSRQELLLLEAAQTTKRLMDFAEPKTVEGWQSAEDDPYAKLPETRAVLREGFRRMAAFRRSMGRWMRRAGKPNDAAKAFRDAARLRKEAARLDP